MSDTTHRPTDRIRKAGHSLSATDPVDLLRREMEPRLFRPPRCEATSVDGHLVTLGHDDFRHAVKLAADEDALLSSRDLLRALRRRPSA